MPTDRQQLAITPYSRPPPTRDAPPPAPTTSRCRSSPQAQQLLSNAFAGGSTAAVGTGTLSLSLGGTSFSVTIDSSDDTLAGIAAAINSASGNPGISATVMQGTDGAYLVLSSSLTGAANTIQVTETDGGNGLSALTYGTGNTGQLHAADRGAGRELQHRRGRLHQPQQYGQRCAQRRDAQPARPPRPGTSARP